MAELGNKTGSYIARHPAESLVVRSPQDVSRAIAFLREKKMGELESRGVIVLAPATTWVDLEVRIGRGTVIYPSVVIEGRTTIGAQCRIYPFVHLVDTRLGDRVKVLSSTMIERSRIEDDAQVGPFTHFRPNTVIRAKAKVGNFVEMKNTVFGERSKAGHLSYLGDTIVEEGVNIGAGTITCNYDGFKKSQTVIERGAFIGSGTQLVAPVRIGRRAYIGAGSVITKDVSAEALAVARGRQVEKPGWVRRKKTK
jgi:bifunctional UDP-N-acetylglucosamine pyrophosphorylase/glucosamine-1-phosphate N-acetyltransferase